MTAYVRNRNGKPSEHKTTRSYPENSRHFQLILPELRGHGRSSPLTDVTKVPVFAEDMLALLDELDIEKCLIVGHSIGGFIAQQIALDSPKRVKKLILIATAPLVDVEAATAQIKVGQLAYDPDPEKAVEKLLSFAFYDSEKMRNTPGMLEFLLDAQREGQRLANSHGAAQGAAASFNVQDRIHEIKLPTLLIIAENDDTFPVKWADFYQEQLKDVTVRIISKSNHSIYLEQPETLAQTIIDYVQR
ncbi:MAG: alpha/beta hydrolase [Candidatus Hermodarchaeota archaeon]|nr:alpha/beta hydrolase [Candidatus Hermodarchaeota archaeon]